MTKISSLASGFKIVYFPIKEEIKGSSRYTETNPVTLGSTYLSFERWDDSSGRFDRSTTPSGSSTLTESSKRNV